MMTNLQDHSLLTTEPGCQASLRRPAVRLVGMIEAAPTTVVAPAVLALSLVGALLVALAFVV